MKTKMVLLVLIILLVALPLAGCADGNADGIADTEGDVFSTLECVLTSGEPLGCVLNASTNSGGG